MFVTPRRLARLDRAAQCRATTAYRARFRLLRARRRAERRTHGAHSASSAGRISSSTPTRRSGANPSAKSRRSIVSGQRIDPSRPTLPLAWDNILNNAEWQHGDVWLKLLQTIVMAFVGTLLASLVAFPLAFLAARNITPQPARQPGAQALLRLPALGRHADLGAVLHARLRAGPAGRHVGDLLHRHRHARQALFRSAGEYRRQAARRHPFGRRVAGCWCSAIGVLPQVLPVFLSQSLYFWESNTRSATIIGAVGAGGIGLKLWEAMRTNRLGKRRLHGAADPCRRVRLRQRSNALRRRLINP